MTSTQGDLGATIASFDGNEKPLADLIERAIR